MQSDLANRAIWLAKSHKTGDGKTRKACSSTTIALERRLLEAAIRKAVSIGIPLNHLRSLSDLVHPDRAETIIDAYWEENGEEPAIATIDLAAKFCAIARYLSLSAAEIERLEGMRKTLET